MKIVSRLRMGLFGLIAYVASIVVFLCVAFAAFCVLIFVAQGGCRSETSYYKPHWKAKNYFDDPQEIALCRAIDRSDLVEIDKLIAEGVDVNKKGTGGMTFLLWSYPAGETSFKRILEHGGDPNVVYQRDFGYSTNGYKLMPGDTLIFLVINTTTGSTRYLEYKKQFENYMQLLIDHGADVNFHRKYFNQTPLHYAVRSGNHKAVRILIESGVDLNTLGIQGQTPIMLSGNFHTILILLEAGTDYRIVTKNNWTIAHRIAQLQPPVTPEQKVYYDKVVTWLADHGVSVEKAAQQSAKWRERVAAGKKLEEIYGNDIPEGSQAPPPGPSTLTKEKLDEYINNAAISSS